MKKIIDALREQFVSHANRDYPLEACGVVIKVGKKHKYFPCRNIEKRDNFSCHPEDVVAASEEGEIVAVFHSHTNGNDSFTEADKLFCNSSTFPFILYSLPLGNFHFIHPESDAIVPLIGRTYVAGKQDCFAIAKDYYKQEYNIDVPEKERWELWWKDGVNLINEDAWEELGFTCVLDGTLLKGDIIVMQNGSKYPDHLAVYIGDQKILHHCYKQLSRRDLYIGQWVNNTVYVLRRKE